LTQFCNSSDKTHSIEARRSIVRFIAGRDAKTATKKTVKTDLKITYLSVSNEKTMFGTALAN